MNIKGKMVTLRAIEECDLEPLRDLVNDPEIEALVCGWSYPISSIQQKKWFENLSEDRNNIRTIVETNTVRFVGYACITDINWKNRTCSVGLKVIRNENKVKNIGYDIVMAMMRYAFDELQMNHIESCIVEFNTRSQRLFIEKLGWVKEGVKRQYIYSGGKYHNLIICSILRCEYQKLIEDTHYWEI